MRATQRFREQQPRWLTGAAFVIQIILNLSLCRQGEAELPNSVAVPRSSVSAEMSGDRSKQSNGGPPAIGLIQEPTAIDGHVLINPYEVLSAQGSRREKLQKLHQERVWAVTELDQQRAELNRLLGEPHHKPVPVPVISEAEYNARVSDLDSKIKTYEAQQNNNDLPESQKADAHAQLIDLTRQKARLALELINYREYEQEDATFNEAMNREERTRLIANQTLSYLSKLDETIGELIASDDAESFFRLEMGIGFLILVTLLIVCFFLFASRSGSMREILRNDRGLQFITLFSLVIAITMFGLLNILEGKELSALLGGLSGYILGRSNLGGRDDDRHPDTQGSNAAPIAANSKDATLA